MADTPRHTRFGGSFVLHKSTAWSDFQYGKLLTEDGFDLLLETGSDILLEQED